MRFLLYLTVALLAAAAARADEKGEKEPSWIIELGGVGEGSFSGKPSFGPSAAVEFTPIKGWLEIEAGIAPMFSSGQTEWDADLLFKKPFTLSRQVEFMIGAGPELKISREGTVLAGEIAADFMFWPTADRKLGWFIEPAYSYTLTKGHEQSLGVTAGLLIAIP